MRDGPLTHVRCDVQALIARPSSGEKTDPARCRYSALSLLESVGESLTAPSSE